MESSLPEDAEKVPETEPVQSNGLETKQTEDGWIIRRPKRMKLTAEESIRRTEEFINDPKRKEQFIAAIRKGKG